MKLPKLILIILIVIVGAAAFALAINSKPHNQSNANQTTTIIASPTLTIVPTPATTGYPAALKAKVRSQFISNCETKGHYSAAECNCAADYLAKNYNESEIAKIYVQYRVSSEIPTALVAARKACVSK